MFGQFSDNPFKESVMNCFKRIGSVLSLSLLVLLLVPNVSHGTSLKTYINPRAFELRDTVEKEIDTYWSEIPEYNYIPSLIEHESCISVTHSRCWSPTSELKTSREHGQGLGQITVAYHPDGSVRFDTLQEMKNRFKVELRELSRSNITSRPDLQIRAIVLHVLNDYKNLYEFNDPMVRLQATDAAYNGGRGAVNYNRRACGLVKGCDTQLWFGHVELHSNKSTKVLYGNRSARQIFLDHPRDVFFNRLPKYQAQYFIEEPPVEEEPVVEEEPEAIEPEETTSPENDLPSSDPIYEDPAVNDIIGKKENTIVSFFKKLFGRN